MTANEIDLKVQDAMNGFDVGEIADHLTLIAQGQLDEVYDRAQNPNRYYQWLSCLMRVVKPLQVVELGAAAGISTLMMASQLPSTSRLYSVDIDPSIAWKWMNRDYSQVVKVSGDDTDLNVWKGSGANLYKTDVWFIDALHTKEHLNKELELYKRFFKKGAIVVLDDIRMEGLWDIWQALPYDKCETTNPNHHTGFGHFIV